jgi:amino acid transporter
MSYEELFDKSKKSILIIVVVLAVLMVLLWVIVVVLPSNTKYDWKVTTLSWILGLGGLLIIGCLSYVGYDKGLTVSISLTENIWEGSTPDDDTLVAPVAPETEAEKEPSMNLTAW